MKLKEKKKHELKQKGEKKKQTQANFINLG